MKKGTAWTGLMLLVIAVWIWMQWSGPRWPQGAGCFGVPRSSPASLGANIRVLDNNGFTVGYSETLANPLWVSYLLHTPAWPAPPGRPKEGFRADPRSDRAISPSAFHGSGYQRGHLAPNYAMYRVHGPEAQRDSFLMTNIAPQRPRLNQKAWQRLEEVIMDHLLPDAGALCIITGPVFDENPPRLPSGVAVAKAYYKFVVTDSDEPRVLAFLIPQNVAGTEPLTDFLVSVDRIEEASGLDFFADLDDATESSMEQRIGKNATLDSVARLPPRY